MNLIIADAFFRFSAITLLLFVAIVLIRDLRHSKSSLYLWLACISLCALFLGLTPEYLQLPKSAKILFRFMDIPHLIFIWLFALSLFQKDFILEKAHLFVGIAYSASIFYVRLVQFEFLQKFPSWWFTMVEVFSIFLMIHMITVALAGRPDDLLKKRRKSRLYFVFLIAFVGISAALIEYISGINNSQTSVPTTKLLTIWPAVIWLCFWLLGIKPNRFTFDEANKIDTKILSSRNLTLSKKLDYEMSEKQAYLENGLTISALAKRLGIHTHKLRDFINQILGHENFSTYTNTFRIEAIKKAFMKSENNHIPILTLAMQHGFSSLSPFNRAFKALEGITPSEFRQNLK